MDVKEHLIFSIDIGTTGVKYAIYDDKGNNIKSLRKKTPLNKKELNTLDVEAILECVIDGTKEILSDEVVANNIEVIGIDGQMGGVIGIDEDWNPVFNFDPPINNNFKPHMDYILKNYGDIISKRTGSIPINGSKIVYWLKEQQKLCKSVKKFVTLSGYIIGKLCALNWRDAFIDRTSLYLFGLSEEGKWCNEIIKLLQISPELLPVIKKSTDIIGFLGKKIANKCNIPSGIPVIAGCGDTAASFLGAGIIEPGKLVDVAGTCSVFGICSNKALIDEKYRSLLRLEAPVLGIYYLVGIGFGGEIHRWFIDNIVGPDVDYKSLINNAETIKSGSNNLMFFPFLGGSFMPPNDYLRGTWLGLDWQHNKYHMYNSLLESIGYEYYYYYKIYQELTEKSEAKNVTVIGGGSKNNLWNTIKANILGINYIKPYQLDYECWGTAVTAGIGIQLYSNIKDIINNNIKIDTIFRSDDKKHEDYKDLVKIYIEMKKDMLDKIYQKYSITREI